MKKTQIIRTSKSLAKTLGCTDACVSRWIHRSNMPCRKSETGFCYEFDLQEVLEWLAKKGPRQRQWVEKLVKKD